MVQSKMTHLRKVGLFLGTVLSFAFVVYMVELLLRTNWGRGYESIGTDVIVFSICTGLLGLTITTIACWKTRLGVYATAIISMAVLPLLAWFIWALFTGVIEDKSGCVKLYGFFRCAFWGVP